MNYLAHILLSGPDRKMQVGNFIGDAVKGRAYNNYPPGICDGILLHRAIDSFTDSHPLIRETIRGLKPDFGRYSGVLLDIWFDYLLSSRFGQFSPVPLGRFTRRFYMGLVMNYRHLPPRIKNFIWHFISTDRLGKYARYTGIEQSLHIMVRYKHIDLSVDMAMQYLRSHEEELFEVFLQFFPAVQSFCQDYLRSPDRAAWLASHRNE